MNAAQVMATAARSDLRVVVAALGFAVAPGGSAAQVSIRCPVHDDRRPSCSISRRGARVLAYCHGCGEVSGDLFALVAAAHGLDRRADFGEVVACVAAALDGAPVEPVEPDTDEPAALASTAPLDLDRIGEILRPLDHPRVHDVAAYLSHRAILDGALADGWRGLDLGELHAALDLGHYAEAIERAGLARRRDDGIASAWPRHRLAIPWRGMRGEVLAIQRRTIGATGDAPRYVFPRGRGPVWPYGVDRLATSPRGRVVVVVEGAADTLAMRILMPGAIVLGVPSATTWRPAWSELLRGRRVQVALDADAAGEAGAVRIAEAVFAAGAVSVDRLRSTAGDWASQVEREASR